LIGFKLAFQLSGSEAVVRKSALFNAVRKEL
jgi:hypothetical protein